MFSGDSALVGGKSVRLKTKMIKTLRRSLGTAFPRLLAPIGSNPLMGTDRPVDETQPALDVLVPVKSAINQITYKDKTCLFKVCYDKKVNSSSVFVPMFLQLKRNHELIPTVFALWRVPDLLRISFVTIPPVSGKLIKPAPADLFFPGVIASNCARGEEWEKGELCSLFVHRNPFAFAVGRTGQTSYAAAAVACKGVAAVVVHNYLDKVWQMERFQPAGFQETSVVPCLAPEPSPELEAEIGIAEGEISAAPPVETDHGDNPEEAAAASAASTPNHTSIPPHDDTNLTPPPIPADSNPSILPTEAAADSEADTCTMDAVVTPAEASALIEEISLHGSGDDEEPEAEAEEDDESMDDLMLCTLFQALQKVPKGDLPLLANIFMGKYFLPSRPAKTTLKVRQSTWGQFGKFLEAMSHVGVLQLTKLGGKGVMAIAAINPASLEDHEPHMDQAREDARELQQLQSGSMGTLFGASANNAAGEGKLNIVQLHRPPDNAIVLFTTVLERQKHTWPHGVQSSPFGIICTYWWPQAEGASTSPGSIFRTGTRLKPKRLYTHADVMATLGLYVGREKLSDPTNKKYICLDAALRSAVYKNRPVDDRVPRAHLARDLLSVMQPFYHVSRGGDDHSPDYIPVARIGRIPNVDITVERNRQRREKFLTRVAGLASFGLDVDRLAAEGTKIFACAVSAQKNPSTPKADKAKELLVHGNMADAVVRVLMNAPYYIPQKYFVVKRAADKKKKKKK